MLRTACRSYSFTPGMRLLRKLSPPTDNRAQAGETNFALLEMLYVQTVFRRICIAPRSRSSWDRACPVRPNEARESNGRLGYPVNHVGQAALACPVRSEGLR